MVNTTIFKILFVVHSSLFTHIPSSKYSLALLIAVYCWDWGKSTKKKFYIGEWRGVFFEVFFY
ncbi:hypothetical protein HMPREF1551_02692 [Capnocytophaga sp. oral taxon 863 str. F0517]|nr:hypothetical protein HMPREF1551_02692 [Capnocytophaga sp. oral taxon 863 str. F0517]